jgi:hypothetical protein
MKAGNNSSSFSTTMELGIYKHAQGIKTDLQTAFNYNLWGEYLIC